MSEAAQQFTTLIKELSADTGQELTIEDGLCSLENASGEIVINMELPESGEHLLFHRELAPMPASPELRSGRALQLLALNSLQVQMGGHWLCTDPDGVAIHLMTSRPLGRLGVEELKQAALNFIDLGNELAVSLREEETELINEAFTQNQSEHGRIQP